MRRNEQSAHAFARLFGLGVFLLIGGFAEANQSIEDERRIEELLRPEPVTGHAVSEPRPVVGMRSLFERKGGVVMDAPVMSASLAVAERASDVELDQLAELIGQQIRITTFHSGRHIGTVDEVGNRDVTMTVRVGGQLATVSLPFTSVRRVERFGR